MHVMFQCNLRYLHNSHLFRFLLDRGCNTIHMCFDPIYVFHNLYMMMREHVLLFQFLHNNHVILYWNILL